MIKPSPKALRCAIYTRVSTEHGLEQDFNSLDAQREAGRAYVKSQTHGRSASRSRSPRRAISSRIGSGVSAPGEPGALTSLILAPGSMWACPILAGNAVSAIENAAPERTLSGAQRPDTVQARSLSPGLGGEFRAPTRSR